MKFPDTQRTAEHEMVRLRMNSISLRKNVGLFPNPEEATKEPTRKQKMKLMLLDREIDRFCKRLFAHPYFSYRMISCVIDVCGNVKSCESCVTETEEIIEKVETFEEMDELISRYGSLPVEVSKTIRRAGYSITESGVGSCGWHLGIPCSEPQGHHLCDLLHWRFNQAIKAGMVEVLRHSCRPQFPHLWTDDHVLEWIKENGLPDDRR